MKPDPEQQCAIAADGDVTLIAGAGTGKTHTLVERCVRLLLEQRLPPGRIIAVTFTNRAARELRHRLRQRVAAAQPALDLEAMHIGTIHSLCAVIVRGHPGESGIDPGFAVLDERAAARRRRQVADALLAEAAADPQYAALFDCCEPNKVYTLIEEILARPGDVEDALRRTGDPTAVLVHWVRGEMAGLAAFHALFAAGSQRWHDDGSAFARRIGECERHWRAAGLALEQARLDDALAALRQAREAIKRGFGTGQQREIAETLRADFDSTIGTWLTAGPSGAGQPVDDSRAAAAQTAVVRLARLALERWDAALRADQSLDFDALERHAARVLRTAGSVRAAWQQQTSAVLVDEYQDTNARQHDIITTLAAGGQRFAVGDPRQSIYGFRGADPTIIDALPGQRHVLGTNRRSHAALLDAIQRICPDAAAPRLCATRAQPDVPLASPPVTFIAHAASAPAAPLVAGTLAAYLWQLVEHGEVRRDAAGICWHDVALLAHTAANLRAYEVALEHAGIPFATDAGDGLYERPEVRELLALLRALALPADDHAMAGWLHATVFGLSEATRYQLRHSSDGTRRSWHDGCRALPATLDDEQRRRVERAWRCFMHHHARVDHAPLATFVDDLIVDLDLRAVFAGDRIAGERRQRNLDHVVATIRQGGWMRLRDYLDDRASAAGLDVREPEAASATTGAVQLMTVHSAKGLEFPIVVLADAARQRSSRTPALLIDDLLGMWLDHPALATPLVRLLRVRRQHREQAESWRLCYVALTRAKERVIICGHRPAAKAWFDQLDGHAEQQAIAVTRIQPEPAGDTLRPVPPPPAPAWPDVTPLLPDPAAPPAAPEPVALQPGASATAGAPDVPAVLLGELAHLALAHGSDPQLRARLDDLARQALWDEPSIRRATTRALELTARWLRHPLCAEIAAAAGCWRELWLTHGGHAMRIDLLYRQGDQWHIIDFKSDDIADEMALRDRIDRYRPQLVRYAEAVRAVFGVQPAASLCLLNDRGGVQLVPVVAGAGPAG